MTKHTHKSWREVVGVHPAADIFPMMSDQELRELGEDVKKNGLTDCVVLWQDNSDGPKSTKDYVVLDGRNRLEAMERAGLSIPTPEEDKQNLNLPWSPWRGDPSPGVGRVYSFTQAVWWAQTDFSREEKPHLKVDPVAFVISANIRRRHLTKQQQAGLIAKAVEATAKETPANMAKVSRGKRGPAKDPVKAKVIEEANKNNISPRTAERALAEHRAPKRSFVPCPECSARTADLDKHMATKHKSKRLRVVEDRPPKRTKKQALGSFEKIAIDVDSAAAMFEQACGDLSTLATYDEAQKWIDMLTDASRRLVAHARLLTREREAVVARKGGSR